MTLHYYKTVETGGMPSYCITSDEETIPNGATAFEDLAGFNADVQTYRATITAPVVVPRTISRRQFFQQLAVQGVITEDEAFAAMSGTLPAALTTLVSSLPTGQQFDAKMKLMVPTFDRDDPIVAVFGTAKGWTSDQIDALWIAAAAL